MKKILINFKIHFDQKHFRKSIFVALLFLAASVVINYYAIIYTAQNASNSVTDIILSNTKAFDVDTLFVFSTIFVILFSVAILLMRPDKIPFAVKSLSLFIFIRSVFTMLTHIGPFPVETERTTYTFLNKLLFGADNFFSGHTGMPFLGALVFWDNKFIRYAYIFFSLFFGVIVLLGHLHYTIDVVSAFFITYAIFHMSKWLFENDKPIQWSNI